MYRLYLSFIAIISLAVSDLSARHIVGGDVSYEFVRFENNNTQVTFRVIFNMYRDRFATNVPFDNQAEFGVYQQQADGSWSFYDKAIADPQNIDTIAYIDDPCINENGDVGVESAFYEMLFTLDIVDTDYLIAYQACCRNRSSSNIFNEDIGSVFDVLITPEAQRLGNNSATFIEYPPIFICANLPLREDISGVDADGDELVYSLCSPLQSGGTMGAGTDPCLFLEPTVGINGCLPPFQPVDFLPPYTADNPMGGFPEVSLNASGQLSGIPSTTGQFVVGVCIEEYRNGVLLSRIRRDFQFNVVPCDKAIAAQLFADDVIVEDGNLVSLINACNDKPVQFVSSSIGAPVSKYEWRIDSPDGSEFYTEEGSNFDELNLSFPEVGEYNGFLVVNDGTQCSDTAFFKIRKTAGVDMEVNIEADSCFLSPIEFTDLSNAPESTIINRTWELDNESYSNDSIAVFDFPSRGTRTIALIVEDDVGCIDTLNTTYEYNPPHDSTLASLQDITLCFGDSIFFDDQWIRAAGTYGDVLPYVETGCDSIGRVLELDYWPEPNYTFLDTIICLGEVVDYFDVQYNETGSFSHSTSSVLSGCDSIVHDLRLEVQEPVRISFEAPTLVLTANTPTQMPVTVEGDYETLLWTPDLGLSCTDCPIPLIDSNTDTVYTLSTVTSGDCASEASIAIDFIVVPERYYFPTILSKDRQLSQETALYLQTISEAQNSVTYDLQVLDRWGTVHFDGKDLNINDQSQGWSSLDILPGVYVYRFDIKEYFETITEIGSITVIK